MPKLITNLTVGAFRLEKDAVLADMRRVAAALQVPHPTHCQYRLHGVFNTRYLRHFGAWQALCAEAGMPYTVCTRQPEIMLEKFVEDVRAVADRLRVRRLSSTVYRHEGSYGGVNRVMQRAQVNWATVCAMAGLLACGRGVRGIDIRRCKRCGHFISWRGEDHVHCKTCRRTLRRRTTGMPVEWSTSRGGTRQRAQVIGFVA